VDHAGEVRFLWGLAEDNASVLHHRVKDGEDWTIINEEAKTGRFERPVGFSVDNRIAYLQVDDRAGTDHIVAYDTVSGERRPLLRHDVVDPFELVYSLGGQGVPVGAQYVGATVEQRFFYNESPEAK